METETILPRPARKWHASTSGTSGRQLVMDGVWLEHLLLFGPSLRHIWRRAGQRLPDRRLGRPLSRQEWWTRLNRMQLLLFLVSPPLNPYPPPVRVLMGDDSCPTRRPPVREVMSKQSWPWQEGHSLACPACWSDGWMMYLQTARRRKSVVAGMESAGNEGGEKREGG